MKMTKPNSWYDSILRWRLKRFLGLSVLAMALGCGGALKTADQVTRVSALTIEATETVLTSLAEDAAERAMEAAADLSDYQARMAPWRVVSRSLSEAKALVRLMDATVQAWRAGVASEGDFLSIVSCLVPAVEELLAALERHGVEHSVLGSLGAIVDIAKPLASGICRMGQQ